jgi:hypothetical protein
VTTSNSIQLKLRQFTTFLNYGLLGPPGRFPGHPVVSVDLTATSTATIQRIGTTNPATHFFGAAAATTPRRPTFPERDEDGLGDVILRLKANVHQSGRRGSRSEGAAPAHRG